jgi:ABC-type phosphate transport system permease subunit
MIESHSNKIDILLNKSKHYLNTTYTLSKYRAIEKIAGWIPSIVSSLVVNIVLVLFIIMLSIGLAFYIGEVLEKLYFGFFIVAGFYFIAWLVLYSFLKKWIEKPISNKLISKMLE